MGCFFGIDSRCNEDAWSFEHSDRPVYVVQVVNIAIVLVLSARREQRNAHVLDAALAELFPALQLGQHLLALLSRHTDRTRRPLIHLNLVKCALALLFFFLSVALQVLRHFGHVPRFEVLLLGCSGLRGHLVEFELHLVLANASHVLLDEVFLVLVTRRMLLDKVAALHVNGLRLQGDRRNLRWHLRELLHFEWHFGL